MAESRLRNPLYSSYSFTGTSSNADPTSRATLKRRFTESTQDPFLAPAPPQQLYAQPNDSFDAQRRLPPTSRTHPGLRNGALVVPQHPAMDPSPDDPDAIFIHPPFTNFPNAHLYKDGLTYNLMATNPEWFLDPADYITTVNCSSTAIRYPTQLEPPRGWCPSKKRELKDGWPEGEEPRLRCTFCRRTYAGVNAKSMWRRHVYEKHKIAMANRRDNNNTSERRGRGSNKENKEDKDRHRNSRRGATSSENEDDVVKKVPSSRQSEPAQAKDAFKTHIDHYQEADKSYELPNHGLVAPESNFTDGEHDVFQVGTSSSTPPLTPGLSPVSSFLRNQSESKGIPESPYNPLLTPSFKHSPARLPSEQPWRFPSPSHPLHSSARELSLYMLVHGEASPLVSGLDVSPVVIVPKSERRKRSIFSSPLAPDNDEKDTHSDGPESGKRRAPKPPKRRLFNDALPTPFADRVKFQQYRVPESPLGRQFTKPKDLMSIVLGGESWRLATPAKTPAKTVAKTPNSRTPGLLGPIELDGEDPFVDLLSWSTPNGKGRLMREMSPPESSPEADSPVLRASQLSQTDSGNASFSTTDGFGLGAGLMEGFTLKDTIDVKTPSSDDLMFVYDNKSKEDSKRSLLDISLGSPPAQAGKKTRRFFSHGYPNDDGDSEMHEASQPKKRRRTVSGRN
ncbi:unnamed protein product [Somion occarium]|uniref:Uncharacterized protein n=1 Tax=Somion occarium TaxID=3059160 RepID=A0ABP1CKV2_9APHY